MQLLYGVTLASIAFALALSVPALLPSAEYPSLPLPHVQAVRQAPSSLCRNMFDDSGSLCGPRQASPANGCQGWPPDSEGQQVSKCQGPVLLGIVHGGSADRALFADAGVVKQGESFGSGFALAEVHANRAVLTRDGERCEVLLFPPQGGRSASERSPNVDESVDEVFPVGGHFARRGGRFQVPRSDLSGLARIRASATARGILLGRVHPGSMAASIGLRSGDIVAEANGQVLTQRSAMEMIGTLSTIREFTLLIRRGAESFNVHIDIID